MVTLKNDFLTLEISTFGAEITKIIKNGINVLYDGSCDVWHEHAPVLFPIAGSLYNGTLINDGKKYNMSSHGFAKRKAFKVVESSNDSATFLLKYDEETLKVYPFKFEFYVTYSITGNEVSVSKKIINVDDKNIYFATGSHEGFACKNDKSSISIEFERDENLNCLKLYTGTPCLSGESYSMGNSTKRLALNNDYFVAGNTLIFEEINSKSLTVYYDGKEYIKFEFDPRNLLIWSMDDCPFICFEFWTNLPDVYGKELEFRDKPGVIRVEKGDCKIINHSFTLI